MSVQHDRLSTEQQFPQKKRFEPLYQNFSELKQHGFTINWAVTLFISFIHLLGLFFAPVVFWQASAELLPIMFTWVAVHFLISSSAITTYNHRLIAHNASRSISWPVHAFYCFFAQPLAVEGSVRQWSANHILHHGVDRNGKHHLDPYSATWFPDTFRNFVWSHLLAHMYNHPHTKEGKIAYKTTAEKSPLIRIQDKIYLPLMGFWIFVFPAIVGFFVAGWQGSLALVAASVFGVLATQHNTWTVNSITHLWGFKDGLMSSAKNNYLWMGPLGEGNHHADHHDCPTDYRNGFGKLGWLLDPTRYLLLLLRGLRLVGPLKRVSRFQEARVIAKRKLRDSRKKLEQASSPSILAEVESRLLAKKQEWLEAVEHWEQLKRQLKQLKASRKQQLSEQIDLSKQELQAKLLELKHEVAIAKAIAKQKRDAFLMSLTLSMQAQAA